jgi:NADP-dependent 3-hydroxy acid dehydrogenase YdfG
MTVTQSLDDAVVVLTGASSGIGRCAAIKLARSGARLAIAARDAAAAAGVRGLFGL